MDEITNTAIKSLYLNTFLQNCEFEDTVLELGSFCVPPLFRRAWALLSPAAILNTPPCRARQFPGNSRWNWKNCFARCPCMEYMGFKS